MTTNRLVGNIFCKLIKIRHLFRALVSTSSLLFVLLFVATIAPIHYDIEHTEAIAGTPTESTLSFTSTSSMAFVDLAVGSLSGTFATSGNNEKAEFSISTDNYSGYTVTLKSSGSDTNLSGLIGGNDYSISTISSPTTSDAFSSTGASGQALNNKWGYIPNYFNSTTNTTTYYPAPTAASPATLNSTTAANGSSAHSSASDTYTIGLGLRADYSSLAGVYVNDTFIIEFTANPILYSISYDDNTGDTNISGMPSTATSGSTTQTSIPLSNDIPTRTGYTFRSWCLGTVSSNGTVCTGTEFNSGASFGIDQTMANTNITLYATWTINTYNLVVTADANVSSFSIKIGSTSGTTITCGQSNTTFTCSNLTYGVDYYLYPSFNSGYIFGGYQKTDSAPNSALSDPDDEHAYYTMGAGNGAVTLSSKQDRLYMWDAIASDCGSIMYDNRDGTERAYTTATINNLCWMTTNLALGKSTTTQLTSATTNVSSSYNLPASSTTGFSTNTGEYIYNSGSTNCGNGSPCYGYYSWKAAVAGTNGENDICPKKWHLPTQTEFNALKNSYSSTSSILASPFLGVYAGYYTNRGLNSGGTAGRYWSSDKRNNASSYSLQFSTSLNPTVTNGTSSNGFSIRCVMTSS